ncbi:unnamed protein product [Adineta steineri]|uniref:alpha-L-rhamnosidase n=1 Tax=Adineta steineri TaxID=433720 RepID=A0A818TZM4_9BILA|nr:unnamed protein product [Adineta steineri]
MFWLYLTVICSVVATSAQQLAPPPFDVRIDHYKVDTTKDLVINTPRPGLSWKLPLFTERNVQQTAYQIQIQSDTDKWDSEKILSSRSTHVSHETMKDLQSSTHYQIRLRVWTSLSGQASSWTNWIQFRTSVFNLHEYIMQKNDDVHWIGSTQIYMNELRKEFNVSSTSPIRTATVLISGIGYYELYVNGQSVDPSRKLDPGWTTYEKRTLMVSYDLTPMIKGGMNAVGVKLGNGWYSQEQYVPPSASEPNYGPPRLMFALSIVFVSSETMSVVSDQTWKGRQGSIVHDSVYNGEIVDSRNDRVDWAKVGFNDSFSLWVTPEIMQSPINVAANGQLSLQDMPPIRAGVDALQFEIGNPLNLENSYLSKEDLAGIQGGNLHDGGVLKPISVSTPVLGVHTFDMGQNMVGWCRFHFHGPRGLGIYIRHAEVLAQPVDSTKQSYGGIYTENLRGATQTDSYILRGDPNGEIYEPRFTVHGFRYISVYGSPVGLSVNDVECPVVHSQTTVKGHFASNINAKGNHTSTGIVSTAQLFPLLSDNGQHNLAVQLVSSTTYPSYGYMFNNPYENATTMWELWDAPMEGPGMNSRNHHMFASIGAWFYSHLAGIDFQSGLIVIHPRMVSEDKKHLLSKVDCQLNTLYGLVHVSYTRDERSTFANSILLRVSIPTNAKAHVVFEPLFPNAKCVLLTESNKVMWSITDKDNTVSHDAQTGLMTVQIGSGEYEYQAFWE